MIIKRSFHIINEVSKVLMGKEDVIEKVLMTIYAGGHILLEDCPGVGKTTLALGLSKALGMDCKRIQFTPDTMPSDIVGFTMYNKQSGDFDYYAGAVDTHLLLADEINRTSPKTQSALLEAMEEGSVTVDGVTHPLPNPFICIATQNPLGSAGTHPLPESQLDRFMVKLSIGYPTSDTQINILKAKMYSDTMASVEQVVTKDIILEIQNYVPTIKINDDLLRYIVALCEATRNDRLVELGVSPRGIIALTKMAKAHAIVKTRNYVVPEDIQSVFVDVCAHRLVLKPQAKIEGISAKDILNNILADTPVLNTEG